MGSQKTTALLKFLLHVLLTAALSVTAFGQTYHVIHNFGASGDGAGPEAGLVFDSQGNLYGTTVSGGTPGDCQGYTCGTIFKLTPGSGGTWTENVIFNFAYPDGHPVTPLSIDSRGNLYGVDLGANTFGAVYKLYRGNDGNWHEQVLHTFAGTPDGEFAEGGVTLGANNMLYGTTLGGGRFNLGMVYSVGLGNVPAETILHSFTPSFQDGSAPSSTYLQQINGSIYGTTIGGGLYNAGTVFQLTPNAGGWSFTLLHAFKGAAHGDGSLPIAGLLPDGNGNFYGVTEEGGNSSCACGTVFKLTHNNDGSWTESVLYSFQGGNDGVTPWGNLIFDHSGNIYGTTYSDGVNGAGTVFKLVPGTGGQWTESVVARLPGGDGGLVLPGGVVIDSAGNIYGTAELGGTYGEGVVFEITP